jgi:hypothetical protein
MKSIYLSGGFHSGWQDILIGRYPQYKFFDPRKHGYTDEKDYTRWDINHIEKSSLVFAYAERNNPSLFGLSFEIGYASAIGKPILLIDENGSRHLGICRASAKKIFTDLDSALEFLDTMKFRDIQEDTFDLWSIY